MTVLLLLLAAPAAAQLQSAPLRNAPLQNAPLQNDCRGPGSIGTALMGQDRVITLNIRPQPGAPLSRVLAARPGDPYYARILSHVGGMSPGDRKPVPPWC